MVRRGRPSLHRSHPSVNRRGGGATPAAARLCYSLVPKGMADFMDQNDQALNKVRGFIERQNIALDGRIPPERTLASELGMGRRLVRRALDVLEQEGRIHRHQGRGTFVDIRAAAHLATPSAAAAGGP